MGRMETVTKDQVVSDLTALLINGQRLSFFEDDHFYICRFSTPREELIDILKDYFKERRIAEGWSLIVEPYEAIFTELSLTKAK